MVIHILITSQKHNSSCVPCNLIGFNGCVKFDFNDKCCIKSKTIIALTKILKFCY